MPLLCWQHLQTVTPPHQINAGCQAVRGQHNSCTGHGIGTHARGQAFQALRAAHSHGFGGLFQRINGCAIGKRGVTQHVFRMGMGIDHPDHIGTCLTPQ